MLPLLVVVVVGSFLIASSTVQQRYIPETARAGLSSLKENMPDLRSLWPKLRAPAAHAPPRQANDTYRGSSWFSDWKWLSHAFSSSVTLDEQRTVLPPLAMRPPIYCYYDPTALGPMSEKERQDEGKIQDAEEELLLAWRRAWWAQGFRPVVLSAAEATNNPKYQELLQLDSGGGGGGRKGGSKAGTLDPGLKADVMRWLAWENMGGGILAHHRLFPMAAHDDPLLSFLRRGKYPVLTRWEGLDGGLFAGDKADVTKVIKMAFESSGAGLKKGANGITGPPRSFLDAVPADQFKVDPTQSGVAFYSHDRIHQRYEKVAAELVENRAAGLSSLLALINSHLHLAWRSTFPHGIAVLKPHPEHTSHLVAPALTLATFLAQCPPSPMPASCPPNMPRCTPCILSSPLRVTTPPRYRNVSTLFTIGTVPHPYTLASLEQLAGATNSLDVAWVRRKQEKRDNWLFVITQELLGTGIGGAPRVLRFKEAVASEFASSHALWLAAEDLDYRGSIVTNGHTPTTTNSGAGTPSLLLRPQVPGVPLPSEIRMPVFPDDLDWRFGFSIPRAPTSRGETSASPVPGPEREPGRSDDDDDPENGPPLPEEAVLKLEPPIIAHAVQVVTAGDSRRRIRESDARVREAIEAWNLADAEAWRFARAFEARRRVERLRWEEEEAPYAGSGRNKRSKGWR